MKRNIVLAAILLAAIAGCKSRSAFNYSESIVKIERELGSEMEKMNQPINKYVESENFDSLAILSSRMENLVDEKLSAIKKLEVPAVPKVENFKRAVISYFSFMKNMYTSYKRFAQSTEGERENERQKLVDLGGQIDDAVKEMQKAQKEYAKANNFKVKS